MGDGYYWEAEMKAMEGTAAWPTDGTQPTAGAHVEGSASFDLGELIGRDEHGAQLARLLDGARSGSSSVLVLRGPRGVGKSALLDAAVANASDLRVLRAAGSQAESDLQYSGLQQLCADLIDQIDGLPAPQSAALGVTFGLLPGGPASTLLTSLAVLSLLVELANEQPVLCVVDDAQWLDTVSARVLTFAARRVKRVNVAFLFALQDSHDMPLADTVPFKGFDELVVTPLSHGESRRLLVRRVPGRLDEQVIDRVLAETAGNPRALTSLSELATHHHLLGTAESIARAGLDRTRRRFRHDLEQLPGDTTQVLLIAACDPSGDPALLWTALEAAGIDPSAVAAAERHGLMTVDTSVVFADPALRAVIYVDAAAADRREAHRAVADACDRALLRHGDASSGDGPGSPHGPDLARAVWHRAQACGGASEDLSSQLEQVTPMVARQSGYGMAAAFLERAAQLSVRSSARVRRALGASMAKWAAGEFDAALRLVASVDRDLGSDHHRSLAELVRAQVTHSLHPSSGSAESIEQLLGQLAASGEFARPESELSAEVHEPAVRHHQVSADVAHAMQCWRQDQWHDLVEDQVVLARRCDMLVALPGALDRRATLRAARGEFDLSIGDVRAARTAAEVLGTPRPVVAALLVETWRAASAGTLDVLSSSALDSGRRGDGEAAAAAQYCTAVLNNSLGRYDDALLAASRLIGGDGSMHSVDPLFAAWALPEFIEAAVRLGRTDDAHDALARLTSLAEESGSDWASGLAARAGALLGGADVAESLFMTAIDRLGRSGMTLDLARAHLLYGEWLRRQKRRLDARGQLRAARELLASRDSEAFVDRVGAELRATGEQARRRSSDTLEALTEREALIASLAAEGLSNPQIATQLFISPRTVEYHLHKVFPKLAITSRGQLSQALLAVAQPLIAV